MLKNAFLLCFTLILVACGSDTSLEEKPLFKKKQGPISAEGDSSGEDGGSGDGCMFYDMDYSIENSWLSNAGGYVPSRQFSYVLLTTNSTSLIPNTVNITSVVCNTNSAITASDWATYRIIQGDTDSEIDCETDDYEESNILTNQTPILVFLDMENRPVQNEVHDFTLTIELSNPIEGTSTHIITTDHLVVQD